jgi:hypothetical protein
MASYKDKLSKMSKTQFEAEMKKYFNGSAPKSEEKQAKDCIFYEKLIKDGVKVCSMMERQDCLGCSFYRTEEVNI